MIYLSLFFQFFKIGLFSIGGGLATLPFLVDLTTTHPAWINMKDISDMVAVSQSTPGPMGVNMATFTGHQVAGLFGSLCATLGLVAPSVIIILIVARVLEKFRENRWVNFAFYGLRATVIALIAYACSKVFVLAVMENGRVKIEEFVLFAIFFVLIEKYRKIHPIVWIAIAAAVGIILHLPS